VEASIQEEVVLTQAAALLRVEVLIPAEVAGQKGGQHHV
jgi:hypothetical protein